MKNKQHNYLQQLVFLGYLNKLLDNDFLALEVRQRLQGVDLATKKYIQDLPKPNMLRQDAMELLWTYIKKERLRSRNLKNVVSDVEPLIESREDVDELNDQLNKYLEILGLPTL